MDSLGPSYFDGQSLCRSHAWQVEGGGIWGLSSAGNSPGVINQVRLLWGPTSLSPWVLIEHVLHAKRSGNRNKTVSVLQRVRAGSYIGAWGHTAALPLTVCMTWLSCNLAEPQFFQSWCMSPASAASSSGREWVNSPTDDVGLNWRPRARG